MPELSIIILNYNSTKLLEDCLSSLVKFTLSVSYEIIVIDNGSVNGDVEKVINKFTVDIKLIKNSSNKGFAAANNQGITEAKGKYILLLNNDTLFIEDVIGKVVEYSKSVNDEAVIGCKLLNSDKTYQISLVDFDNICNMFGESFFLYKAFLKNRRLNKYYLNYILNNEVIEAEAIKGAFFFVPKQIFDKVGLLDERFHFYYEETDFCYRHKQNGGKVYYLPNAEIIHIGGGSTSKNLWLMFKNQHIARLQFFGKYFRGIKYLTLVVLHEIGLLIRAPFNLLIGLVKFDTYFLKKAMCYLRSAFYYPIHKNKVNN